MTQQHNTHVANETDEDLEVIVKYDSESVARLVPAGEHVRVPTHRSMVTVKLRLPFVCGGDAAKQFYVVRRLKSDYSVLIRKMGTQYIIYQSLYGHLKKIDENDEENK